MPSNLNARVACSNLYDDLYEVALQFGRRRLQRRDLALVARDRVYRDAPDARDGIVEKLNQRLSAAIICENVHCVRATVAHFRIRMPDAD